MKVKKKDDTDSPLLLSKYPLSPTSWQPSITLASLRAYDNSLPLPHQQRHRDLYHRKPNQDLHLQIVTISEDLTYIGSCLAGEQSGDCVRSLKHLGHQRRRYYTQQLVSDCPRRDARDDREADHSAEHTELGVGASSNG